MAEQEHWVDREIQCWKPEEQLKLYLLSPCANHQEVQMQEQNEFDPAIENH